MTEQPGHPDLNPGDEADPPKPGAGDDLCSRCSGSGRLDDGSECPECGGTGKIVEAVGGG